MNRWGMVLVTGMLVLSSGCAINFSKRSPNDIKRLEELNAQLEHFKSLAKLKESEAQDLKNAKSRLEQELAPSEATVGYDERGLVARMLDQVLFDSGKAELRSEASSILARVAEVLQEFPNQPVGIEGHTDNQPIKHSGWASNKALSEARANAVVAYLVNRGVDPGRLIPVGYADSRPIADNATPEGRQKNRRVEIIILPQASRQSYGKDASGGSGAGRYSK